jgi:Fe(3+) dicitrate transport protein
MKHIVCCLLLAVFSCTIEAKYFSINGHVYNAQTKEAVGNLVVEIERSEMRTRTDSAGGFSFSNLYPGNYKVVFKSLAYDRKVISIIITDKSITLDSIFLTPFVKELTTVTVQGGNEKFGVTRLHSVEGTAIYDGKKNEVILLKNLNANLATNCSRQIFSKVPGINIWESDAAGLQIGIATRGLDPNRTSNFNTRQNGYDMSADALGYPDSYYVPPAEAVEKIEVIRGAASLQYGPQFGGMLNYVLQKAPSDKKIEWTSYTTAGAYKLINTFNSIGGTVKCFNYFGFYNYKQGESWRPNGGYKLHNAFARLGYQCSEKLALHIEYTLSRYVAQQSGGLTDAQFNSNAKISLRNRNWFATNWNILALSLNYNHNTYHHFNVRVWGFMGSRDAVGYLGPANRADDESRNRDLISDQYKNIGAEARYLWKYYIGKSLSSLLVGVRYYNGVTNKKQGFGTNKNDADFNFASDSLKSSDYKFPGMNIAVFSENVFNISNRVKITPGIRYEHIQTKATGFYKTVLNEIVDDNAISEQRNFSRNFVLLGLGLSYNVWNETELYANFSQNYRGITFTDMRVIRTSQIVDLNLKDEKGFNFDIGYRGEIGNWFNFDASAYWLQYNNRIGQIQITDSAYNIFRYTTNVGTTRSIGAEVYVEADFLSASKLQERTGNLSLFISTGYTNAIYTKSPYRNVVGNNLEFAPQFTFRSGVTYRYKKFSTTIQGSLTGKQFTDATNAAFTANAVNGIIPTFYVLDWSAKYSVKIIQLSAGINNLTNNKYFTRRAVSYPGPGIIPAEPLTFFVTLGIKLNEQAKKLNWNTF